MAAMSRSALANDGDPAFLVLLMLLLAISLVAVIRLPRCAGPSDDDTHDEPGHPPPKHAARTRRAKLEDRQCFPRGEAKTSPSGLVPASCPARAASMRAATLSASGYPTGVRRGCGQVAGLASPVW